MSLIWAAISLGFLGSFHCVGMCGPIALALPLNRSSTFFKVSGVLMYNLGRVITYSLLGVFFGLIGESLVIAGFQQIVSIMLGAAILIMVLLPNQVISKFKITALMYGYINRIKQNLGVLFKKNSFSSLFFIGTLNGLLPCGLVYLGIAGAIASGTSINGMLFMAMFGLGTLPAMLALPLIGNLITLKFRNKINKAVPMFMLIMAVLLILRGANLGIPYVSPELSSSKPLAHNCCHK